MIYFDRRRGYDIILCSNGNLCVFSKEDGHYSKQYKHLTDVWSAIDSEDIVWDGFLDKPY